MMPDFEAFMAVDDLVVFALSDQKQVVVYGVFAIKWAEVCINVALK